MIRLHHVPQSRSERVLWLLGEMDAACALAYEVVVHPFDRSLRAPDYLALSPAGRVPALEMDGRAHFESGALVQILCERFPEAGLGRAPGHPERADWLVWLHFAETITQEAVTLTMQHVTLRDPATRSPVLMRLAATRLERCFAAVEDALGGAFLLPEGFSAADIAVGQAVHGASRFADPAPFPRLADWLARLRARPAFAAAQPAPGQAVIYDRAFYPAPEPA